MRNILLCTIAISAIILSGCDGGSNYDSQSVQTKSTTVNTTVTTTVATTTYSTTKKSSSSSKKSSSSSSSKEKCPYCNGLGEVQQYYTDDPYEAPHWETCQACHGTGKKDW